MTSFALGPGGRRMPIEGLPSRRLMVGVSPDGRWRVACSHYPIESYRPDEDCKGYGDGPCPVGGWTDLLVEYIRGSTTLMMFAPDGSQLAFVSDGELYLVSMPDGQPRRLSA
jgi:hypothetical protein